MDVVIEGAVSIPVFVEDAKSIGVGKILKLYQTVHPVPAGRQSDRVSHQESLEHFSHLCFHSLVCHCLHELVDQLVILLSSDSLVLQSDVQGVIEQRLDQKSVSQSIRDNLASHFCFRTIIKLI